MNRTLKLILVGVIIVAVLAITRDKPYDNVEFSDDLSEVQQPARVTDNQINTVDFRECNEDAGFSLHTDLGSGGLKIISSDDKYCYVETRFEIEGGYFINECTIPLSAGEVEFVGNNFEVISSFCKLKTKGNALLELENKK